MSIHQKPSLISVLRLFSGVFDVQLITKKELSARIGVTCRTLESWMRLGHIPYIKIGRSVRFDPEAVGRFIRRRFGHNFSMEDYDA